MNRLAGLASGAARFWLRTSIRTQEHLIGWLGDESDKPASAIDAQTGIAGPLVVLAVGTKRYRALKDRVVEVVLERLPSTLLEAQDYATSVIDLENTIVEKMNQLTNEEYESILRPIFKDDEPLMITVGGVLGGVVGELQVLIIEQFGH